MPPHYAVFYNLFTAQGLEAHHDVLSKESRLQMMQAQCVLKDESIKREYGYGLAIEYYSDLKLHGHAGGMPGHLTRTMLNSDKNIVISIMGNGQSCMREALHQGLWHIIDFFDKHESALSETSKNLTNCMSLAHDIWGNYHFLPVGTEIFVTSPNNFKPFEAPSILTHHSSDDIQEHYKITREGGYGNYGQDVRFIFEASEKERILKNIPYAGYPMMDTQAYKGYLKKVPQNETFE